MTIDLNIDKQGPELKVTFYGTRGAIPVPDANFLEYGGNTTCVGLTSKDLPQVVAVFDAGTGIRNFGNDLIASESYDKIERVSMMFTHFHWDHIQGFPFFEPAYNSAIQLNLLALGADRKYRNLKQIFSDQMREMYFPVKLENMGAEMVFISPESDLRIAQEAIITVNPHSHPGGCWGYRLELPGRSIVFCTDVEHGEEIDLNLVKFARGADLLIHEAQYTDEELLKHRGWGHSSYSQALEVARLAEVGFLAMTHHDPDHDDAFLAAREKECQQVMSNCVLAREGMEFIL